MSDTYPHELPEQLQRILKTENNSNADYAQSWLRKGQVETLWNALAICWETLADIAAKTCHCHHYNCDQCVSRDAICEIKEMCEEMGQA